MLFYGWKPFLPNHNIVKFGGLRHFGSGDMSLNCYVISQDYIIKGLCNSYMVAISLKQVDI